MSKVAVIGSGYVGTTTAAILANSGHKVVAVDVDKKKVEAINAGKAPFFEAGLDELVDYAVKTGSLQATTDYAEIAEAEVVFSCVGTPDNPDGSSNLSYVFAAAKSAAKQLSPNTIYAQKSTVPVGTGAEVEKLLAGKDIRYVSNPEFLREGTAIADALWFDRIVAGGDDQAAVQAILDLYKTIEDHRMNIAQRAGLELKKGHQGSYISTNRNSAELIKVTANAFLALKISFANSIAKLADETGADVTEVMDAVGADHRIGRAFLNAGRGYGGGCFPKDVSGLISSATEYGVDLSVMTAAAEVNETMPGYIANKTQEAMGGDLQGKRLAVLGLAFKPGTSDSRRSPGVNLANILHHSGAKVTVYDPEANGEAKADLRKGIDICQSAADAIKDCDGVLITTEWPEFTSIDLKDLAKQLSGDLFVDCQNCFDNRAVKAAGLRYVGVGRD